MEYHESVDYLESLQRRRPKLGTETTAALLTHLDRPHEDLDCVQIAGSNGKGSTACMLERVLRDAGLDVGLYTSPDLNDLRERIQINGRKIPKQRVQEFVAEIDDCVERLREVDDTPTYFEVLTALALHHFANEDVDVAVLEVGIGGRYDATSAVDPVASAVTSVSLEHTDILGDTIEEIARDKAQVSPADAPLVTGASGAALEAIRSETDVITVGSDDADVVAREHGLASPIESEISIAGPKWSFETRLPLVGPHQATNAGVAATLADQVAGVDPESIARGLRDSYWPGRFEVMSTTPLAILDGAHNPGACETLASLVDRYSFDDLHLVFGAMREKDHRGMAAALPSPMRSTSVSRTYPAPRIRTPSRPRLTIARRRSTAQGPSSRRPSGRCRRPTKATASSSPARCTRSQKRATGGRGSRSRSERPRRNRRETYSRARPSTRRPPNPSRTRPSIERSRPICAVRRPSASNRRSRRSAERASVRTPRRPVAAS